MELRDMTLSILDDLRTIERASSGFRSEVVGDAVNRLINAVIDVVMKISEAYSGLNKCAQYLVVIGDY